MKNANELFCFICLIHNFMVYLFGCKALNKVIKAKNTWQPLNPNIMTCLSENYAAHNEIPVYNKTTTGKRIINRMLLGTWLGEKGGRNRCQTSESILY